MILLAAIFARGVQDWSEEHQFIFWVVAVIGACVVSIVALIGYYFGKRDDDGKHRDH